MAAAELLGSWRLLSAEALNAEGRVVGPLFGAAPSGHLDYAADGTMTVNLIAQGAGAGLTPWGEPAPLEYTYAGSYSVDGDQVRHHVTTASDASLPGQTLRRHFATTGDQLTLWWRLPHQLQGQLRWVKHLGL